MSAKILPLRPHHKLSASPFDELTDRMILKQAEAGTLNPAIVAALLAAIRQPVWEASR